MIDRDIHLARALLVDSNPLLRSVTTAQLKDLGIGQVSQAARVSDARLLLERETFDIVICNRDFDDGLMSGQDLLDELRRENQLPYGTVFIMVTSGASYHQVVEAAEAALDGFLVRPYTAAALGDRLLEARTRKRALADIFKAIDAGELETAFARALKRFQEQLPYWPYCGRVAAELLLRLNRPADARKLFERMAPAVGGHWARLGVARAMMALGDNGNAGKLVAAVLAEAPGSADAHDLMGRVLVDQCDFETAMTHYRSAAEATPGCLLRAQHAGALAFYLDQGDEARRLLERTLSLGVQSKLFDALSLVMLALLRFDAGDSAGTAALREQLRRHGERAGGSSPRLQRLEAALQWLCQRLAGDHTAALAGLRELSAQAGSDDFDLETANLLLSLWSRLPDAGGQAAEHDALVQRIAMRFCISKAITEILIASARRGRAAADQIRACQTRVAAVAEEAMDRSMSGDPARAVQQLLQAGEDSRNAKLLEMAAVLARRHQAALADSASLVAQAHNGIGRWCRGAVHIAGIQRSGRSPGGLQLRG